MKAIKKLKVAILGRLPMTHTPIFYQNLGYIRANNDNLMFERQREDETKFAMGPVLYGLHKKFVFIARSGTKPEDVLLTICREYLKGRPATERRAFARKVSRG